MLLETPILAKARSDDDRACRDGTRRQTQAAQSVFAETKVRRDADPNAGTLSEPAERRPQTPPWSKAKRRAARQ